MLDRRTRLRWIQQTDRWRHDSPSSSGRNSPSSDEDDLDMVPRLPFMRLPREIRRQIYRLCTSNNLRFTVNNRIRSQNRPIGWVRAGGWAKPRGWVNASDWKEISWKKLYKQDCWCDAPHAYWTHDDELKMGMPKLLNNLALNPRKKAATISDTYEASGLSGDEQDDDEASKSSYSSLAPLEQYKGGKSGRCPSCHRHYPDYPRYLRSALPALLLLCRQVTNEVEEILYAENIFLVEMHNDGQKLLGRLFSPERRDKMRKLVLLLQPKGPYYIPTFRFDPSVWYTTLSKLSMLGIVAEQPRPSALVLGKDDDFDELRNLTDQWMKWLHLAMEHLLRMVPKGPKATKIMVDANNAKATMAALQAMMPPALRSEFRTLRLADGIFDRAREVEVVEQEEADEDSDTSTADSLFD
ncbi:hypothetical protein B0H63DRAFT_181689 [Podospora didyma]|uniref:Uncharacterized protein n=1 Tax=Podospora didyma TaxID=330526 RepID=A0AAE0NPI1_9PEZI|nr:hypothetical protein B0H63DRAFT_181689 [Podospora didyma]